MKRCCTIPEAISRALGFARIADLAQIDGVGEAVAEYIYKMIIRDSDSNSQGGSNISYFSAEVLRCAFKLPRGNPIRAMMAAAFVKEFVSGRRTTVWSEMGRNAEFAMDVLKAVRRMGQLGRPIALPSLSGIHL